MIKTHNKYITAIDYANKTLLVSSGIRSRVSLRSFTTLIGAPVGITSARINLVFFVSTVKLSKWNCQNIVVSNKKEKNVLLARSKLNSIEKIISKN